MRTSDSYREIMHSPYSEHLIGFIEQRKALGFKYENQIWMLLHFDDFVSRYPCIDGNELQENLVVKWVEDPMITTGQKRKRSILLRQFGEYMQQIDKVAYLYPKRKFKAPARYLPYIFTHSQISAILEYADKDAKEHSSVSSRVDTAIILRLLYGCGLRISEALSLKMQDVDLDNGVLHIWDSKFQKDRMIPMSQTLMSVCIAYSKNCNSGKLPYAYFFSPNGNRGYSAQTIYNRFRDVLFICGIPHRGKGKGPRLHDLRHTFAVHSLQQLAENGEDLYTVLPILSEYMGHSSVSATQYYLRLTAEVFPDIMEMVEEKFGDVYPEVVCDE